MSLEKYPALRTLMSVLPPDSLRDGDRIRVCVQDGKVFPQRGYTHECDGVRADIMVRPRVAGGYGVWLTYETSRHGDVNEAAARRVADVAAQKFNRPVGAHGAEVTGLTDEEAVLCFWYMAELMLAEFPESPKETVR